MAFKHGNHTLIDLDAGNDTKITSAAGQDIVFYPDQHIWIKQGTKLIFEGTVPDDFEAKLQATAVTADRDIILPDEDGTLATQAYVTSAVTGGALSNTDALAEGSTNLYYTNARVDARIASNTGASLDLSGKTTTDLAEGTNLYYTDARVDARIASNTGGSLDLSGKTTTDLAEGTNLYYTDARVDARLSGGSLSSITTGDITSTGDVTVGGDLTVSGTTTTINTNELNIGDNIITLNSDETGTPSQNAGIEVERGTSANVAIRWNEATDQWEFSNDGTTYVAFGTSTTFTGTTDGINEGTTNLYYTDARADARATLRINAATTDNISEGTGNLYYTDARVRTEVEGSNLDMGSNNITTTGKILFSNVYTNLVDLPSAATYHGMFAHVHGTGKGYYAHGGNWIRLANYDELTYVTGSNLDLSQKSTTDLPEGTNLYFTNARAISALTSADVQTDSLGVGTAASGTTGEIRATHDVTAYYSSDANLKTNVVNIENALDKVKQIRGVEFDWTQEYIDDKGGEDGYFVRKHDVGVIAQEVEAVLPEVVGTRENGTKAVRYDRMVALLIEAIKDQQSQIDELKQIITDLSNK